MPNYLAQPVTSYISGVQARETIAAAQGNRLAQEQRMAQLDNLKRELEPIGAMYQSGDVEGAQRAIAGLSLRYPTLTSDIAEIQKTMTPSELQRAGQIRSYAPQLATGPEGQAGFAGMSFDPVTGKWSAQAVPAPEGMSWAKETPSEKRDAEAAAAGEKEREKGLAKQSVEAIGKAYERMPAISKGIFNLDRAITAIDRGAKTGVAYSYLPSVKAASIELDQIRNELGLDVVGATTFGALSESELALALDTALPKKLGPAELREWLIKKREAQTKLREGLIDAIDFLGKGGTIPELVSKRRAEQAAGVAIPGEPPVAAPVAPASKQPAATQTIGRFQVEIE